MLTGLLPVAVGAAVKGGAVADDGGVWCEEVRLQRREEAGLAPEVVDTGGQVLWGGRAQEEADQVFGDVVMRPLLPSRRHKEGLGVQELDIGVPGVVAQGPPRDLHAQQEDRVIGGSAVTWMVGLPQDRQSVLELQDLQPSNQVPVPPFELPRQAMFSRLREGRSGKLMPWRRLHIAEQTQHLPGRVGIGDATQVDLWNRLRLSSPEDGHTQ